MRWTSFVIAAYVVMALEVGLAQHIAIDTSWGPAAPSFALVLAVFISLHAPIRTAVLACGILGLLVDLAASPYTLAEPATAHTVTLIGPYALGYAAGGYLVILMRPMLIRRHPMALAVMSLLAGAEVHLVVLALLWVRQWYEPLAAFHAVEQLSPRALGLLYTSGLAIFLAFPLSWSAGTFAFPTPQRNTLRAPRTR